MAPKKPPKPLRSSDRTAGRYSYDGLQRPIHERARLGIVTSLMAHPEGLSFNDLKELCGLTDGNLNRHLQVLRDAGLVAVEKEPLAQRQQTRCSITARGRDEFAIYLAELERVVADAAEVVHAPLRRVDEKRMVLGVARYFFTR